MNHYIQHGTTTTLVHCLHVSYYSYKKCKKLKLNYREAARGGLLHDMFLYDWHDKEVRVKEWLTFYKLHGFTHPETALQNAARDFDLTQREKDIIKKHMWPLTIIPPSYKEAWIVTMADKYCSLLETFKIHRGDMCG